MQADSAALRMERRRGSKIGSLELNLGKLSAADSFLKALRMVRSLAFSLAAGLLVLAAPYGKADETFPVAHPEPIAVRVLDGGNGKPIAHVHLTLIAGYDKGDIKGQAFHEDALTDDQGKARLSNELANLPFLQVWVTKVELCQTKPRAALFSIDRIRRDGLSAPNLCGTFSVENAPGVFTVFVRNSGKKKPLLHVPFMK
jgi:hypothetical protein